MDMAAHRGEETLGALEVTRLVLGQHTLGHQFARLADAIEILGDPEEQVQVAQPALAFLDVGFDDIARVAHTVMPLVTFRELGLDEVMAVADVEFLRKATGQFVEQLAVAPEIARFQQRGADRLVALGIAQALLDGAGGMPDLQAEIPQQVEHELDDLLAARRLLVGAQEEEIDVGQRRQLAPSVAARCDHSQPLGGARIGRGIGILVGKVEQDPDDLVHQIGGCHQDRRPVVAQRTRLLEPPADFGPAVGQGFAQQGQHRRAGRVAAGRQVLDQGGQGLVQGAPADDGTSVGDLIVGFAHVGAILQVRPRPCQPSRVSCHKGEL